MRSMHDGCSRGHTLSQPCIITCRRSWLRPLLGQIMSSCIDSVSRLIFSRDWALHTSLLRERLALPYLQERCICRRLACSSSTRIRGKIMTSMHRELGLELAMSIWTTLRSAGWVRVLVTNRKSGGPVMPWSLSRDEAQP